MDGAPLDGDDSEYTDLFARVNSPYTTDSYGRRTSFPNANPRYNPYEHPSMPGNAQRQSPYSTATVNFATPQLQQEWNSTDNSYQDPQNQMKQHQNIIKQQIFRRRSTTSITGRPQVRGDTGITHVLSDQSLFQSGNATLNDYEIPMPAPIPLHDFTNVTCPDFIINGEPVRPEDIHSNITHHPHHVNLQNHTSNYNAPQLLPHGVVQTHPHHIITHQRQVEPTYNRLLQPAVHQILSQHNGQPGPPNVNVINPNAATSQQIHNAAVQSLIMSAQQMQRSVRRLTPRNPRGSWNGNPTSPTTPPLPPSVALPTVPNVSQNIVNQINTPETEGHASTAAYILIGESGEVVSAGNTEEFGFSTSQLTGKSFTSIFVPPYREFFNSLIDGYHRNHKEYEAALAVPTVVELCHIPKSPSQNRKSSQQGEENSRAPGTFNVNKCHLARVAITPANTSNSVENSGKKHLLALVERYRESSAMVTTDANGIILTSRDTLSVFGKNGPDVIRQSAETLFGNFDYKKEQSPSNVRFKHANGTMFWAYVTKATIGVSGFTLNTFQIKPLSHTVDVILLLNSDHLITRTSVYSLSTMFNLTPLKLVGRSISEWMVEDDEDSWSSVETEKRKRLKMSDSDVPDVSSPTDSQSAGANRARFKHGDGGTVLVHFQSYPITHSQDQKIGPAPLRCLYEGMLSPEDPFNGTPDMRIRHSNFQPVQCLRVSRVQQTTTESETEIEKYLFLETIGLGAFSKVKKAVDPTTGQQIAIKIVTKSKLSAEDLQRAHRETEIMMTLDHSHIVKLHRTIETPKKLYLIMDYVDGCDLMGYVIEHNGLSEADSKGIFIQLVSALFYCHQRKVIHRDVKHKNILINRETKKIMLIDFGLSNWNEEGTMKTSYCGTPAFASPEMVLGHQYEGHLVDVWSAAVVLYSMLTARFPFSNVGELISGNFIDPPNVSEDCCKLIRSMLVVDPASRASLQESRLWSILGASEGLEVLTPLLYREQRSECWAEWIEINQILHMCNTSRLE
ncbi:par-1, isoform I [Planoprotostelium fungivorum]|uniref:non-specific serine/threonine protein kinase n=1 Tax=Planoprotostelium fungivorum TaxID=1890364 RepID=A0A2P6NQC1_9EUKA|nr:par-1, isoform I [Planoprotostelium fungivorum]